MNEIRKQDFVVPIISDSYLRRNNCMYEITQLIKDENYKDRTFPVIIDLPKTEKRDYPFFHALYRAEIIKYWEDEAQKLKEAINTISAENRGELDLEIREYCKYSQSIASFLDWFKDNLVGVIPSGKQKVKMKQKALEIARKIDDILLKKT